MEDAIEVLTRGNVTAVNISAPPPTPSWRRGRADRAALEASEERCEAAEERREDAAER